MKATIPIGQAKARIDLAAIAHADKGPEEDADVVPTMPIAVVTPMGDVAQRVRPGVPKSQDPEVVVVEGRHKVSARSREPCPSTHGGSGSYPRTAMEFLGARAHQPTERGGPMNRSTRGEGGHRHHGAGKAPRRA